MTNTVKDNIHATCVDIDGKGVLILGPSGSGKSSLAISLITLGARLVADDRCEIWRNNTDIIVTRPHTLPPAIEARGLGILNAPMIDQTRLELVVDLSQTTDKRLPDPMTVTLLGVEIPNVFQVALDVFPQSLYLLVKYGDYKGQDLGGT